MYRNRVFNNFLWRFMERRGAQGVTLIVSIVLARLLNPNVYGLVSLVIVFTTILQVFVDSGLGNALIQKKDVDDLDFSSVFYFNMMVCALMYALIFFAAPLIADFYNNTELVNLIRVMSITLIISGMKNVQQAYVSRNLLFKKFFYATLVGTIGAAVVGIWMAYKGYGVWALVIQNLLNQAVDTIILWITVKWRPKKMYSWQRLKGLLSYGWKLLVSSFIDTVYQKIRQLLIGKIYSPVDLAYYNQGQQVPYAVVSNINASIDSVLLPTISAEQDNVNTVKAMTRRVIKTSTFIMAPMLMGIASAAEPLVRVVFTEKWLPCVFFLRIACITFMFSPINTSNLSAIKAVGRSDIVLKLEIIKKVAGLLIILSTVWFGVKAIAVGLLVSNVIGQIVNSWPNKRLLDYSYFNQIKDILPTILLAFGMGITVYSVSFLGLNDWWTLLIQIPLGVAIYIGGAVLFKMESLNYCLGTLKGFIKHLKGNKETIND